MKLCPAEIFPCVRTKEKKSYNWDFGELGIRPIVFRAIVFRRTVGYPYHIQLSIFVQKISFIYIQYHK